MWFVIIVSATLALAGFLLFVLPAKPWLEHRRREAEEEPYDPERTIDPSDPPPVAPQPEDDLGPGDRDVPPGSRVDRRRHGKP